MLNLPFPLGKPQDTHCHPGQVTSCLPPLFAPFYLALYTPCFELYKQWLIACSVSIKPLPNESPPGNVLSCPKTKQTYCLNVLTVAWQAAAQRCKVERPEFTIAIPKGKWGITCALPRSKEEAQSTALVMHVLAVGLY